MTGAIADRLHMARTFARAGVLKPSRPDRALRAVLGLHRWGPTLAAGYLGSAARYPAAPALVDERGTLTFDQVQRRTNALTRGLAGHGIRGGDRVAIMCRNHRGFVEASIACSKLGAHAVYLNTAFAAPQVSEVVARENPAGIVYDQEFERVVSAASIGRKAFLAWCDDRATSSRPVLEELIATRSPLPLPPPLEPGRAVILTSGTTGTPKGANRANPASLSPAAALLSTIPLRARETTMIAAP